MSGNCIDAKGAPVNTRGFPFPVIVLAFNFRMTYLIALRNEVGTEQKRRRYGQYMNYLKGDRLWQT